MTDWRTTFNDLCNEIEILEIRAAEIKAQLERVNRQMKRMYAPATKLVASYSGMPGSGFAMMPFEQIGGNIIKLQRELDDINDVLSIKIEARDRMVSKMNDFKDLTNRVLVMRDVQRKTLKEIADELGYTYDWIRKVSSKVNRMYKIDIKKGTIKAQIS